MGIYWCAVDIQSKEKIEPPLDYAIKTPGLFHPNSPFPGMVMMMNTFGYNFEMVNDTGNDDSYYNSSYKDITSEVYAKYLTFFPWAKDDIYEPKDKS